MENMEKTVEKMILRRSSFALLLILTILASDLPIASPQETGPSILADLAREQWAGLDSDSIAWDASLSGIYRWSLWMDNLGNAPVTFPSITVLTQYPRTRFPSIDPDPIVTSSNSNYSYDWSFPSIDVEGYGADVYMESDLETTFSLGFDARRDITPLNIASHQETQTVVVVVKPHESFRRIYVEITSYEDQRTVGAFLSASPVPSQEEIDQGYIYETEASRVAWNYPGIQTEVEYTFAAQFLVTNKAYPGAVTHKPRVKVHGQSVLTDSDFPQATSLTVSDSILGNITYRANPEQGPYSWRYLARDRKVVTFRQQSPMAPGTGQVNARYIGVRRENTQNLVLQPGEAVTFTPPAQEGWSLGWSRLRLFNIATTTGPASSLDEVYSLVEILGGHVSEFYFMTEFGPSVNVANNPGQTSITVKNRSPDHNVMIETAAALYTYYSYTGIRPVSVVDLGGGMRSVDVTVPQGFVNRYMGFFNYKFRLNVDWWDVGRAIPTAIYNPDPSTGAPSSRNLWEIYRNDRRADFALFSSWGTSVDIVLSAQIGWGYIGNDGQVVGEQWGGLVQQGETVEGTWSIQLQVLDTDYLQDTSIPGTTLEGSLRLEKRVLWNTPITLTPGSPYSLIAPQIAGWYRDESDYLYIVPDPANPTQVMTDQVMVSPAIRTGQWWFEYSADWHPLGGSITLQLDPSVTESVTFLFTYIVGYETNLQTAGITVTDTETNEGTYIRHDLEITLPEYSAYASLGFDDPPISSDLSFWTPSENWLLGGFYTPEGLSAEDPRLKNEDVRYLPDTPVGGEGRTLGSGYQYRFGMGSSAWMSNIYNVMQVSGYSAAGTWHWTVREPITKISHDATVTFEGQHREYFETVVLGPSGSQSASWSYVVPTPPSPPSGFQFKWLFESAGTYFQLGGLSITQDALLSGNVLRVAGAHLVSFKWFNGDNYAAYAYDPQSTSITIENLSSDAITIGYINAPSRYVDINDVHSVDVYDIPPDFRRIYLDVPFGFIAAQQGFFNNWLSFRLRWQGKAIPYHVYSPGPVGRYIDILQVYRADDGAGSRLGLSSGSNSMRVRLSRMGNGLYESGIPVEGTWRLDLKLIDATQSPIAGPELKVFKFSQKTVKQTFELSPAGTRNTQTPDSITIVPAAISGWYRMYSDELIVTSNTPGVGPEALTITSGTKSWEVYENSNYWITCGDNITLRNTSDQTATFTIGYSVYYRAPLPFNDAQTQEDDMIRHDISFIMPPYDEFANLGFDVPPTDSGFLINTPLTDPPWSFSSFTTPSGENADDQKFSNPSLEYLSGYVEGETIYTLYGLRSPSADFPYAVLGDAAAGTWTITAYEPATMLKFTLRSPADLLVTDPLGRQVGFNGQEQLNQIPGATYTGPASEPEILTIPNPIAGTYNVQLIGTATGTYTLTTETSVGGIIVSQQIETGSISEGTTVTSTVSIENPEGMPTIPGAPPPADGTPPSTVASLAGTVGSNGWYISDVQISFTATDNPGGSGVQKTEYSFDGTTWNAYSTEVTITNEGTTTIFFRSVDNAGNFEATQSQTMKIDKTPPTITVSTPTENGIYILNAAVASGYACTDSISSVASCTGSAENGANFDTSTVGSHLFTVTAYDEAGNHVTQPLNYIVQYASAGQCLGSPSHQILQPINPDGSSVFKKGSTVPAKFRVCDVNGISIGTPGVVSSFKLVQIIAGTTVDVVNEEVVSTTPDTAFRWDPTSQQWIFNINTKTLTAGKTYVYVITLNDGTTIQFKFGLK
jgi:hypothetical protein